MKKKINPYLIGLLTGEFALLLTIIIGTLSYDFHHAIINMSGWGTILSAILTVILLEILISEKELKYISKVYITSSFFFIITGWIIIYFKEPIEKIILSVFPILDVWHTLEGYPSYLIVFLKGLIYTFIIGVYFILFKRPHKGRTDVY
jgi:hypothetical protein